MILHEHSCVTVYIRGDGSKTNTAQAHKFLSNTEIPWYVLLELVTHLIKIFPDVKPKVVTTKTHNRIQPIACEIH